MKKLSTQRISVCLFLSLLAFGANAQKKTPQKATAGSSEHVMLNTTDLQWKQGPDGLPAGAKVAGMEGDPTKAGPFTVRLIFPANYKIMPHWHTNIEHITVLEGEFFMGHGDAFDEAKATALHVGGFAVMPSKFHHYAFTKGKQVVVQLHGMGPFDINYIDPANDPRKKK